MKRIYPFLFLAAASLGSAGAAPVLLGNQPLQPPLETVGNTSEPSVPVGALEKFGVRVLVSSLDATRLRLRLGQVYAEYSAITGWRDAAAQTLELPAPQTANGVTVVPLRALQALGFNLELTPDAVNISGQLPLPVGGLNQVTALRATRKPGAVVLSFARAARWDVVQRTQNHILLQIADTAVTDGFAPVGGDGLSRVRWWQAGLDAMLDMELTPRVALTTVSSEISLTVGADASPDLPPSPGVTPPGVTYTVNSVGKTKLHLVSLDPQRFQPKVLVAPWGGAWDALEAAKRSGAAVVMNGSYFDPATLQAVDYLVSNGQTLAYWRGTRAGVGFAENGLLWGAPRSRVTFAWNAQKFTVNNVQAGANPKFLTSFVGDGFAPVGGLGYISLSLKDGRVSFMHDEAFTPAPGELTLTFNPAAFPGLKPAIGDAAILSLTSSETAWLEVSDGIAAGPQLVRNGQYAVNPQAEGFDTSKEIWRSTRQVGFGVDGKGWYVVAMLELGTPEEFARALVAAGVRDALRMDSGSSAQIALGGGLVGGRWARTVPDLLAFVPR